MGPVATTGLPQEGPVATTGLPQEGPVATTACRKKARWQQDATREDKQ
jgi:hypothetical protein